MPVEGARDRITQIVLDWAQVTAAPHRFNGRVFQVGQREIGHIHGDHLRDIPFPTRLRHELIESGQAQPHHILPDSGWVSLYIQTEDDVQAAIDLLRLSYEAAVQRRKK